MDRPLPAPGAFAQDVLELVEQVPPGQVLTYGDVARLLQAGAPIAVGRVMARHGVDVPWWRVVRADGSLPAVLLGRARQRWRREGTPVVAAADGIRPDLARARWDGLGARIPRDPG
ncbi:MGMT family protein [Arsenicicoccus dermatophilus]|uniref:MGMT family protein n=1 Tax=Arsenicicoccus dermatophilus TaxID=1076331 RepID=UPI001F4D0000|nr:MGMT family protein [Arsenicicoccus dermatophilus]